MTPLLATAATLFLMKACDVSFPLVPDSWKTLASTWQISRNAVNTVDMALYVCSEVRPPVAGPRVMYGLMIFSFTNPALCFAVADVVSGNSAQRDCCGNSNVSRCKMLQMTFWTSDTGCCSREINCCMALTSTVTGIAVFSIRWFMILTVDMTVACGPISFNSWSELSSHIVSIRGRPWYFHFSESIFRAAS